jgi:hypothetical protein
MSPHDDWYVDIDGTKAHLRKENTKPKTISINPDAATTKGYQHVQD